MSEFDLKAELLSNTPVDLSPLEGMAETYHAAHEADSVEYDISDTMLTMADRLARSTGAGVVLFLSGLYAVAEEGIIADANVLATITGIRPVTFLEEPLAGLVGNRVWQPAGLGLVLEPREDILDELPDGPLQDLRAVAGLYAEVVIPLNHNIVMAANPMLGSPSAS